MNRRSVVCGLWSVVCWSVPGLSAAPATTRVTEVSRQVYLMGTRCDLVTYAADRATGLRRLERLVEILEETEDELSTWRADSVLSRLNRAPLGHSFHLNPRLCRLFDRLHFWWQESHSAFDPAIGSLIDAWGVRTGREELPSEAELRKARGRSGFAHLELDADQCHILRRREVTIDAGAFGKGEALDRILVEAREAAGGPWLVDLGGQIMVSGVPPGQVSWSLSLAHPLDREEPLLMLQLLSGALATSGASERSVQLAGRSSGHILDPRQGRPATFEGSVTVWHPQALTADILSTALYVMGPEEGLPWAQTRNLAACFLVPAEDRKVDIRPTPAFRLRFLSDR